MDIHYDAENRRFHLQAKGTSYVIGLTNGNYPTHLYWGRALRNYRDSAPCLPYARGFSPYPAGSPSSLSFDTLPMEYPAGNGDYRDPALGILLENGSNVSDLRYKSHCIYDGKPKLEGLPAVYAREDAEAKTLSLLLADSVTGLEAELLYTVFRDYDAVCRSARLVNNGKRPLRITRAASASVEIRRSGFELVTLWGGHANERNLDRAPLTHGTREVSSIRGASSHQFSPFAALCTPGTNEDCGEVYAMSFVYSGNFSARAHVDQFDCTRLSMGLNPQDFSWLLNPGESFQTPEAVLVYSAAGFGGMSSAFHKLYRERLARGKFQYEERPILINNWEATYFKFDAEKIYEIAKKGKELGMELFVLDDGWFGHRDDDRTSLGDWVVNEKKLPGGLDSLIDRIAGLGMRFGLWFEPEMVSEDSDLFRAHPDWCLHVPERPCSLARSQLVLDFSRADVCAHILDALTRVLENSKITYVKWDMNRHMTEVSSALLPAERQQETAHRYMLGLYGMLETLTSRFPDILFESCSGGGGRFDAGFLYYMPQAWTSDNTDAICRLKIQHATSLVFPPVSMGSHLSASPNHQVGRATPLETRAAVAMSGCFGYELDITKLSAEEQEAVKAQTAFYKTIRKTVQYGDYYRILSPFDGNEAAWCFVSPEQTQMFGIYVKTLAMPNSGVTILKFKGLNPEADYRDTKTGVIYGGDELMYEGISIPLGGGDFSSRTWVFEKV